MTRGRENEVPSSHCLGCGRRNDLATSVGCDARPNPGDITVCIACGHIMVFSDDLTLRNPTDAEIVRIAGDKRLLAVQHARASVERDRAYCEDFVRETIKRRGVSDPSNEMVNYLVEKLLAAVPKPPRKAR